MYGHRPPRPTSALWVFRRESDANPPCAPSSTGMHSTWSRSPCHQHPRPSPLGPRAWPGLHLCKRIDGQGWGLWPFSSSPSHFSLSQASWPPVPLALRGTRHLRLRWRRFLAGPLSAAEPVAVSCSGGRPVISASLRLLGRLVLLLKDQDLAPPSLTPRGRGLADSRRG